MNRPYYRGIRVEAGGGTSRHNTWRVRHVVWRRTTSEAGGQNRTDDLLFIPLHAMRVTGFTNHLLYPATALWR